MTPDARQPAAPRTTGNPLQELQRIGQSPWQDNIHRGLLTSGALVRLIRAGEVTGLTSNPTIFEQAIMRSGEYDDVLRSLLRSRASATAIVDTLVRDDIRTAAAAFRPVYDRTDGRDGFVSVEVAPRLAHDTAGTVAEARRLWESLHAPNVMIKIPATAAGIQAIEECIAAGINVNVTLIFSLHRHDEVMDAYVRGLERRLTAGLPVDRIASVASFFVSRVDTAVDALLDQRLVSLSLHDRRGVERLRGRAAIANAKLAYAAFRTKFRSAAFTALAEAGARVQRPLWASTSTKNPAYPDVYYIDALVGPDTVNTMPPTTLAAYRDHGHPESRLDFGIDEARRVMSRLAELGISIDEVTAQLERDGVASFVTSWDTLVAGIAARRDALEFDARTTVRLGSASRAVDAVLATLDEGRIGERLARRDPPASRASSLEALRTFAGEVRAAGVRRAVLCGFGGSVLMARALRDALGVARGAIDVDVLDSTHPDAVRAIIERKGTEAALWVVVDPSGTSPESDALLRLAWERSGGRGDRCVAVTTAGSALEASARERGFLRVFADPSGSDHRFGALSFATLVPAALLGIDMAILLERAEALHRASTGGVRAAHHPALPLAAALVTFARAGRDKLTILAGDGLTALAEWIGQLVAGGLGKRGTGIVPVVGEGLGKTSAYGRDRFFVALEIDGHPLRAADTLARAGLPVIRYRLRDGLDLGAECLRWEIATAAAAHLLGIDPFDQPDMHATADGATRLLAAAMPPTTADALAPDDPAVATRLSAMLRSAGTRAWVAINAWTAPVGRRAVALDELRALLRDRFGIATVAGFAPASLHASGQLQHGGPDTGIVLHLTSDVGDDVAVPALTIGFGTLTRALALADVEALAAHQRRVLHVDLGSRAEHGMHLLVATLKAPRRRPPRPVRSGRTSRTAARRARR